MGLAGGRAVRDNRPYQVKVLFSRTHRRVQDRDMARATMRTYGKRWARKRKQLIKSP